MRKTTSAAKRLEAVKSASFSKKRLMYYPEYKVFEIVESLLKAAGATHRVFAQANLGEFLTSENEAAFRAINSKRVDILVVDYAGEPLLAVEYQGKDHYQGDAKLRDDTKKEALRRAGVGYLEVVPADSNAQIRDQVRDLLALRYTRRRHNKPDAAA